MRTHIDDYILGVLSKPYGEIAVYKRVDTHYKYIDSITVDATTKYYIKPRDLDTQLRDLLPDGATVTAFLVKPDVRKSDDVHTIERVTSYTSIVKTILELLNIKIRWVKSPIDWKDYFLVDKKNPKESALEKAKELMPNVSIESTEQAEAILIGLYGIREVVHSDLSKS